MVLCVETCHHASPFSNQYVLFSHLVLSSTNSNLPGNSDFEKIFIYTHTHTYIIHVECGQWSSFILLSLKYIIVLQNIFFCAANYNVAFSVLSGSQEL